MKILLITHYLAPHTGGIEIVAENQARELAKRGHNVTILTSTVSPLDQKANINGVQIIRIPAWNILEKLLDVPFPLFSPIIFRTLQTLVQQHDIVHAHGALYTGSVVAAMFCRIYHKPLLVTEHVGFVPYGSWILNCIQQLAFHTIGRITLSLSSQIWVLNDTIRSYLLSLTQTPITILFNGIDTNIFKPINKSKKQSLRSKYTLPKTKPIILYVGRFVEKKGIKILRKAINPAYHLVLVGSNIITNNRSANITILPAIPHSQIHELYQASDIFILMSQGEGFPLVIQEALASGLPVVTRNSPQNRKLFNPQVCVFANPSPRAITDTLKRILKNKDKLQKMQYDARAFAVSHWSWEKHVHELEKIYSLSNRGEGNHF